MKYSIRLLLLPVAIFTVACNAVTHIYVPNVVNQPLLKKKNELQAFVTHTDLQAAYAITDHIGVMVNGQYLFRNDLSGWDWDLQGGMGEAGIGYFVHGKNKIFTAELYAGYGKGRFHTYEDSTTFDGPLDYWDKGHVFKDRHIIAKFDKYFIQPGVGWDFGKTQVATALRISVLRYNNIFLSPQTFQSSPLELAALMEYKDKNVVYPEASVTFRKGGKRIKFQAQLNFCFIATGDTIPVRTDFSQNLNMKAGIVFNLTGLFRK